MLRRSAPLTGARSVACLAADFLADFLTDFFTLFLTRLRTVAFVIEPHMRALIIYLYFARWRARRVIHALLTYDPLGTSRRVCPVGDIRWCIRRRRPRAAPGRIHRVSRSPGHRVFDGADDRPRA